MRFYWNEWMIKDSTRVGGPIKDSTGMGGLYWTLSELVAYIELYMNGWPL